MGIILQVSWKLEVKHWLIQKVESAYESIHCNNKGQQQQVMFVGHMACTRKSAKLLQTYKLLCHRANFGLSDIYSLFPVASLGLYAVHVNLFTSSCKHCFPISLKILFLFGLSFSYNFSGQSTAELDKLHLVLQNQTNYILLVNQHS